MLQSRLDYLLQSTRVANRTKLNYKNVLPHFVFVFEENLLMEGCLQLILRIYITYIMKHEREEFPIQ